MGLKTLYYSNTRDGDEQLDVNDDDDKKENEEGTEEEFDEEDGCAGGACTFWHEPGS